MGWHSCEVFLRQTGHLQRWHTIPNAPAKVLSSRTPLLVANFLVPPAQLDDVFYKFGRIVQMEIKRPARPPAFAFISYSHPRDAEDAVSFY